AGAAERDDWQSHGIVPRKDQEVLGNGVDDFGNLRHVAASFLYADDVWNFSQPGQGARFDVGPGAAGDVVKDDRLLADSFRDCSEMPILSFLGWLIVVRRGGEDGVYARPRRHFLGLFYCIVSGI